MRTAKETRGPATYLQTDALVHAAPGAWKDVMNKLTLSSLLLLVGCNQDFISVEVTSAPERVVSKTASDLFVTDRCPIYTPNGGDIDTPELPFQSPVLFGCGVDSAGETYGLVTGDIGDLAVLTGLREIGVFFAFDSSVEPNPPTVTSLDLDGAAPQVRAWSAPDNVMDPHHCCAEDEDGGVDRRIPIRVIALGASGMLLSLGLFDRTPTQVAVELNLRRDLAWFERFYVDGPPPVSSAPGAGPVPGK